MADKRPEPARDTVPGIPDTPENIARAIIVRPPKEEWRYLKRAGDKPAEKLRPRG